MQNKSVMPGVTEPMIDFETWLLLLRMEILKDYNISEAVVMSFMLLPFHVRRSMLQLGFESIFLTEQFTRVLPCSIAELLL